MAIPFILIITLVLGGGISVVADTSLPRDALYSVKTEINERVAGMFAVTSEAKARWAVRKAERRIEEAEKLKQENRLDAEMRAALNARIRHEMENAERETRNTAEQGDTIAAAELSVQIGTSLKTRAAVLDEAMLATDGDIRAGVSASSSVNSN